MQAYLSFFSVYSHAYIRYYLSGFKCLCSEETMGRSILGFAAIKGKRLTSFSYDLWTGYGGNS